MNLLTRLFHVLLVLLLASCKFNLSPYIADNPTLRLNKVNLDRIKEIELTTPTDFKVAVLADSHNYYDDLEDLIKEINKNGPYSFVIVAGDITNLGLIDEYDASRTIFNKLNSPYLIGLGNHDLLSNGEIIFDKMFGRSEFAFEFMNAQFVFFNNNNWESAGTKPDTQWVESQLSTSSAPHKILVAHVSPKDTDRFSVDQRSDWEQLVSTYQVNYFINGHDHNPVESSYGSGTQITVGAPSKRVYLELLFTASGVSHKKISF